jgi:pimeloyl-ACP methyl ester carboxylesterase
VRRVQARSGDISVNVIDWRASDNATPLLAIHGITANARAFDGLAAALGPAIGLVAPDLRGRGESDKPDGPYGVPAHVTDMVAVLDALGLDAVAVAGWSLGALVGLHLAATHPERVTRLILLDPPIAPIRDTARESLGRVQGRLANHYTSLAVGVERSRSSPALGGQWDAALEAFVRADLEELPDGTARHRMPDIVRERERAARVPPLTAIIPNVACPVLILRATDTLYQPGDELLTAGDAARAARLFSDARTIDIPGTNHYTIVLGAPAATVAAMAAFLQAE